MPAAETETGNPQDIQHAPIGRKDESINAGFRFRDHLVHEGAGRRRADLQHDRERVAVAATHIVSHAYRLCVRTGTQKTQAPPHCIGAA